jgi:hypothetical protein
MGNIRRHGRAAYAAHLPERTLLDASADSNRSADFAVCVSQAELCCEHARVALRQSRYKSAEGLFITARALYKRATQADAILHPAIELRLKEIQEELMRLDEIAKNRTRASSVAPSFSPDEPTGPQLSSHRRA